MLTRVSIQTSAKPLRVGFLTTIDTNIGDDFIRESLVRLIRGIGGDRPIHFVAVNKHDPHTAYPGWHPIRWGGDASFKKRKAMEWFRRPEPRWLPRLGGSVFDSCDVVVQCGTPILWEGCRQSEWAGPIWRDVLHRLSRRGVPVLNLGGGSCYAWERLPKGLRDDPDEGFVRLMLETCALTTVRDPLAQKLFASLGFGVPLIRCPAFLAGCPAEASGSSRLVLFNYMHGGGHFDFEQKIDSEAWRKTCDQILAYLQREGWQPLLVAHNAAEMSLAARHWPQLMRCFPRTVEEYFAIIRGAHFGVFNRMHASVAAAGLGIPSLAIGDDSRMLMVGALGLPTLYVKDATSERVVESIRELVRNRAEQSDRLRQLWRETKQTYESILRPYF